LTREAGPLLERNREAVPPRSDAGGGGAHRGAGEGLDRSAPQGKRWSSHGRVLKKFLEDVINRTTWWSLGTKANSEVSRAGRY
jgi:hypothetical protein